MGFLKIEVLDNGREVLKMKNSVVGTIITADYKILVATQTRPGSVDKDGKSYKSMGCVAGYVDDGEDYDEAFFRELEEESNLEYFHVTHIIDLTKDCPKASSEGYSTEKSKMYVGLSNYTSEVLSKIIKCNDEDEDITLEFIEPDIEILNNIPGMKSFYVIQQAMNIVEFLRGNVMVIPVKLSIPEPFTNVKDGEIPVKCESILGDVIQHVTLFRSPATHERMVNFRKFGEYLTSVAYNRDMLRNKELKHSTLMKIRHNIEMCLDRSL
ncbi:MAG: NUDIX domain-containing protein [Cetobacterium sp.]|uniref:NUDIX domain-containing protein n=1 Tax=Cetobacterium sp. TaxID=2071632 RepID=UPI003F3ECB9B